MGWRQTVEGLWDFTKGAGKSLVGERDAAGKLSKFAKGRRLAISAGAVGTGAYGVSLIPGVRNGAASVRNDAIDAIKQVATGDDGSPKPEPKGAVGAGVDAVKGFFSDLGISFGPGSLIGGGLLAAVGAYFGGGDMLIATGLGLVGALAGQPIMDAIIPPKETPKVAIDPEIYKERKVQISELQQLIDKEIVAGNFKVLQTGGAEATPEVVEAMNNELKNKIPNNKIFTEQNKSVGPG